MNGFDVLRAVQAKLAEPPPVIFLTARTEEIDRVVGLELGADDYCWHWLIAQIAS